ncbi:MAG: type 1 secretion system ATPase component [Rhodobacteraceae bacterium HLUCCA12]|nr:MAG: type 1 secretion system ATPase component [Rhodobacteraceae bacterium HLUCCA12]
MTGHDPTTIVQPETGSPADALLRKNGVFLVGIVAFSALVNLLMLTGPVFMLQIYERVLTARAVETLGVLFALVVFLYAMMFLLDHARMAIAARIGAAFRSRLDRPVLAAARRIQAIRADDRIADAAQNDLAQVQTFLGSPLFPAILDLPWTPIFVALVFALHPELGMLAAGGGVGLVMLALINRRMLRGPLHRVHAATREAAIFRDQIAAGAETLGALGMRDAVAQRWKKIGDTALRATLLASDRSGLFTAMTRAFRLLLQSSMLALGAWLVLRDQITPGVMLASSIILGRALAPVEQVVGQWVAVQAARDSWQRLDRLLSHAPESPRMPMPRPHAHLQVRTMSIIAPGTTRPTLHAIDFVVQPGRAVGVIGPCGAGKSALARTVIGAWQPASGDIRLDGIALDQFEPDALGRLLGYLPQQIALFDGTIAENIARLDRQPDPKDVVRAARLAGAHAMILGLSDGYDTRIAASGKPLSGGQVQRIGLARALYGDPVLLVLDEPNAHLDDAGAQALNMAIRAAKARGASVLIMAHRPAAIQECDDLLMLDHGRQSAFGPRDSVLRAVVRNHAELTRPPDADAPGAIAEQSAPTGTDA